MQADVEGEILAAALLVDFAHGLAHPHRRAQRPVRRREGRHHRVADRLHHRAALGRDRGDELAEMAAHEIEGGEVADPVVERGRAPEVGEQDGEARDLEALLGIERAAAIEVAERLVAEEPGRGQERPAAARTARPAPCPWSHRPGSVRRADLFSNVMRAGPGCSVIVPLWACASAKTTERLRRSCVSSPGNVEKERRVGDRIEGDDEALRQAQRHRRLLARRELHQRRASTLPIALSTSSGRSAPEPQKIWRMYSARGSESGSCAAMRRTRGLTVKVTSISWSSVGS